MEIANILFFFLWGKDSLTRPPESLFFMLNTVTCSVKTGVVCIHIIKDNILTQASYSNHPVKSIQSAHESAVLCHYPSVKRCATMHKNHSSQLCHPATPLKTIFTKSFHQAILPAWWVDAWSSFPWKKTSRLWSNSNYESLKSVKSPKPAQIS